MVKAAKKDKRLYDVLGVSPAATPADIKKAYRRRAKEVHPNNPANSNVATEWPEVAHAYRVLVNAETRARYDKSGAESDEPIITIDARAMGLIGNLINKILSEQTDPNGYNILAELVFRLAANKEGAEGDLIHLGILELRAANAASRTKPKAGGDNLLARAFESHATAAKEAAARVADRVAVLDRAIAILTAYEFEPDKTVTQAVDSIRITDIRVTRGKW